MNLKKKLEKAEAELSEITGEINRINEQKEHLKAVGNKLLGKIETLNELIKEAEADDKDNNGIREQAADNQQ